MAKKAKDILLANGFTEEQLKDPQLATMLNNPAFCRALEVEAERAETAESERTRLQTELDNDAEWYRTQAAPAIKKATDDAVKARADAAAAQAQLQALQDYGLTQIAKQEGGTPMNANSNPAGAPNAAATTGPSAQFVTPEQLNSTLTQGITQLGDLQQMMTDIPFDHRDLFGQPLPGGISGLRKSYREAVEQRRFRGSIQDFWEQTYKVSEKRSEVEAARRQAELDAYAATKVKEAKEQLISEYGNPMTRPVTTSRSPFTNRSSVLSGQSSATPNSKPGDGGSGSNSATQPWERGTPEARGAERVQSFVRRQMEKTA